MTDELKRLSNARAHVDPVRGRVVVLADGTVMSEKEFDKLKTTSIMHLFAWRKGWNNYEKEPTTPIPNVKPKRAKKDRHKS
jgi:ABC-type sugar transport system ATPase subunit